MCIRDRECPDLFELPVEGTELKKWVLVCNINPGGPFGGSATQYFVGTFDGKKFVNESPAATKWMDFGKDHYATVTWSNAPAGRSIALAWMSNWQYANDVPTKQYRSANSVPRDLSLYTADGETYLKCTPSPELLKMRGKAVKKHAFKVDRTYNLQQLLKDNTGTYEIEMTIKNRNAQEVGFQLYNACLLYTSIQRSRLKVFPLVITGKRFIIMKETRSLIFGVRSLGILLCFGTSRLKSG